MIIKSRAFTLVETMVVVAIIAIITAVGVTSYGRYSAKGKWAEVQPCIAAVTLRMQNYYTNRGVYPTADVWNALYDTSSGTGNSDPWDCGDHYAGQIQVFGDGGNDLASRFMVIYTDSRKSIKGGASIADIWVMTDVNDKIVHVSNSVDNIFDDSTLPADYRGRL